MGYGKLMGGGFAELASKCDYGVTCVWHSGDEPGSAS